MAGVLGGKAAQRAISLVGDGYVYGATGWVCSPARRAAQAKQYPEYTESILQTAAKWDGKRCWDCAQLTREAARAAGAVLPSGATSQWRKAAWARKGEIASLPAGECAFVYRLQSGSQTVMAHAGVSIGDGSCVHAKGTAHGVVREAISSPKWTHWASPWREEGEAIVETATVTAASGKTVNLRLAPDGKVLARVPVGSEVVVTEHGKEWCAITWQGTAGYMQSAFLVAGVEARLAALEARVAALESRMLSE